jgi:DNA polymerase-3 subunit epsilon
MGALDDVVIFDCQATGPSPKHGFLLEAAWRSPNQSGSHVVTIPDGETIPARAMALTGIGPQHQADAVSPHVVHTHLHGVLWPAPVVSPLPSPRPMVIHFAQFERPWLQFLWGQTELPFPVLCTHAIAKRLLTDLPSRGLRAVAGFLGHDTPALKRSAHHVEATTVIWSHFVAQLQDEFDICTTDALVAWLAGPPPTRGAPKTFAPPLPRKTRLAMPKAPGVYRFLGAQGEVLYVGKATSLHQRVNSYFQKRANLSLHKRELVTRAFDVEFTETESALEAALLESDEIKRHNPGCNVAGKTNGRAPVWCTRELLDPQAVPDAAHPWGPFPRPSTRASLLASGSDDLEELLGWADQWMPEPEVFSAGLALFRDRHSILDAGELLTLGDHLWPELWEARHTVGETAGDEEPSAATPNWTDEGVCGALEQIAVHVALWARRAFWFQQMEGGRLRWITPKTSAERTLIITPLHDADLPPIAAYDRMCVLTAELRRLLAAGVPVCLELPAGVVLAEPALRAAIAWV